MAAPPCSGIRSLQFLLHLGRVHGGGVDELARCRGVVGLAAALTMPVAFCPPDLAPFRRWSAQSPARIAGGSMYSSRRAAAACRRSRARGRRWPSLSAVVPDGRPFWIGLCGSWIGGSDGSSRWGRGATPGEVRDFSRPTSPNDSSVAGCGDVFKWSVKAARSAMVLLLDMGRSPASSPDDDGAMRCVRLHSCLPGLDCNLGFCLGVVCAIFRGRVSFWFLRVSACVLYLFSLI